MSNTKWKVGEWYETSNDWDIQTYSLPFVSFLLSQTHESMDEDNDHSLIFHFFILIKVSGTPYDDRIAHGDGWQYTMAKTSLLLVLITSTACTPNTLLRRAPRGSTCSLTTIPSTAWPEGVDPPKLLRTSCRCVLYISLLSVGAWVWGCGYCQLLSCFERRDAKGKAYVGVKSSLSIVKGSTSKWTFFTFS